MIAESAISDSLFAKMDENHFGVRALMEAQTQFAYALRYYGGVPIEDSKALPHAAGVYVAFGECIPGQGNIAVYVGESRCIRKRLADRPELAGTTVVTHVSNQAVRKLLEGLLIASFNPPLNGASSYALDPQMAAEEFWPGIWAATLLEAGDVGNHAMLRRVARRCYQREKAVRHCWKTLQKSEALVIANDRAILRSLSTPRLPVPLPITNGQSEGWQCHGLFKAVAATGGRR